MPLDDQQEINVGKRKEKHRKENDLSAVDETPTEKNLGEGITGHEVKSDAENIKGVLIASKPFYDPQNPGSDLLFIEKQMFHSATMYVITGDRFYLGQFNELASSANSEIGEVVLTLLGAWYENRKDSLFSLKSSDHIFGSLQMIGENSRQVRWEEILVYFTTL